VPLHITDECINCGSCEESCPTGAIREDETCTARVIDPERCTECVGFYTRTMCQSVCPVECCLPDPAHHLVEDELLARAVRLFPTHDFPVPAPSHFKR